MFFSKLALRLQVVRAVLLGVAALLNMSAVAYAADMNKVIRDVFPAAEEGLTRPHRTIFIPARSSRRSSRRSTPTTISRDPPKSCRWTAEWHAADHRQRARRTRSSSRRASCSRPIRRSAARSASWSPRTYIYSLKRLADPEDPLAVGVPGRRQVRRPRRSSRGRQEDAASSTTTSKIAGLEAVDKYTLRLRLKDTDYNLPYVLAHEPTSAVAREVDREVRRARRPGDDQSGGYPDLTGSRQWVRSSKIVLEANPDYRGFTWDFAPQDAADQKLVAQMKGKKMPQVGRVEISIIEEDQARWLAFQNRELDIMNMEGPLAPQAIDERQAQARARRQGHPARPHRRSGNLLHVLEHAGPGRRRSHEGKDRAAPRDGDVLQRRRRTSR